jgi:hypothetical protein
MMSAAADRLIVVIRCNFQASQANNSDGAAVLKAVGEIQQPSRSKIASTIFKYHLKILRTPEEYHEQDS